MASLLSRRALAPRLARSCPVQGRQSVSKKNAVFHLPDMMTAFASCTLSPLLPFAFCGRSYHIDSNYSLKRKQRKQRSSKKHRGRQAYRFVDRTRVQVSGGSGGNGSLSMYRIGRKHKRRPDGGHGGNGGSVLILADPNEQSLRWTKPHVKADPGTHGSSQEKHGRNGKNTIIRVPCGVVVRRVLEPDEYYDSDTKTVRKFVQEIKNSEDGMELCHHDYDLDEKPMMWEKEASQPRFYRGSDIYDSDEDDGDDFDYYDDDLPYDDIRKVPDIDFTPWGERERVEIADLDKPGSHVVVATGGRGGLGSSIFASHQGPLPPSEVLAKYAKPREGETAFLELELKLIADLGLVGFPNAGKSSLLAATSRATPHIAPYPFTTLNPLVGFIEYQDGFRVCAADVPGLIAGASEGRGKGHDFLRHLERTKALLYIVDAAAVDGRDPINDFQTLVDELAAYGDGDMLNRRCLVVANKVDLLKEDKRKEIVFRLHEKVNETGIRMENDVLEISAGVTGEGLSLLTKAIRSTVIASERDRLTVNEKWYL
mmetsp:Transcript_222/g.390  ORF Transcript_222/g.390 Transcript_222/m.390 type:complete len:540 (+) Transcript_222:232-1851(+)